MDGYAKLYKAVVGEEEISDIEEWKVIANRLLASLLDREQNVIRLRYGLSDTPKSLREIGEIISCNHWTRYGMRTSYSCERIRQIEADALRKLRRRNRRDKWSVE